MKVINNFLDRGDFLYLKDIISSNQFKWALIQKANSNSIEENQIQLVHSIIQGGNGWIEPNLFSPFNMVLMPPIMNTLKEKMNYKKVVVCRAKVNCFMKQPNHVPLGYHQDIDDSEDYKTILLHFETNNGYTEFKTGEKITTVANRALIFDAHKFHQTVTQTDIMFRRNININYMEI